MLHIRQLGRFGYDEAYDLQHALVHETKDDYILIVEHPPVYTMGSRKKGNHLLVDVETLGARIVTTDRGGDITFHGPGQIVVYPIISVDDDLSAGPLHVRALEQLVINVVGHFGLRAFRKDGFPGVWVESFGGLPRKIAAVGARTTRVRPGLRRTLHGVALNVETDLSWFQKIVPCGIADFGVTSMANEGATAGIEAVGEVLRKEAITLFSKGTSDSAVVEFPIWGRELKQTRPNKIPDGLSMTTKRLLKAGESLSGRIELKEKKPPWLRVKVKRDSSFMNLAGTMRELGLTTVCEEAGCPNIYECWSEGTATFMINGERCTRACSFCLVDTRKPLALDPGEPLHVAQAAKRMGLSHAVITCVARDDLEDGGAQAMAETIRQVRKLSPECAVEVLMSDVKGDRANQELVFAALPDVLNHNLETVARLQHAIRPQAGYGRSLALLARSVSFGLKTKSGIMVGLGESEAEVHAALYDLASVGVSIVTIGQYLRPSSKHAPVARYWEPEEFDALKEFAMTLGIRHAEASPLTRSSYHAKEASKSAELGVVGQI